MKNEITTIGQLFSLKNKRQLKIEIFVDIIKNAGIKTIVDIRSIKEDADESKSYHPVQLKTQFQQIDIQYISIGQKIGEFYKKYNSATLISEKTTLVEEEFCKSIITFIDNFNTKDSPVGLLFSYWEANKTWKGIFSKHIFNNYDSVKLNHIAPGRNNNIWTVYTNSNLYNDAYGYLLSIYDDMINKSKSYNSDLYTDDWGYTNEELNDMYRDAFDGNSQAEWNID